MRILTNILLITTLTLLFSCDAIDKMKGGDDDESDVSEVDAAGKLEVDTDEKDGVNLKASTLTQLAVVEENMIPGSLAIDDSSSLYLEEEQGDPCEGIGFFDCQPNLLKLYMWMAKNSIAMAKDIMEHLAPMIHQIGYKTGAREMDDGDDMDVIFYDIKDKNNFEVLLKTELGPFLHVTRAGPKLEIDMDGSNEVDSGSHLNLEGGDDHGPPMINLVIDYVDEDNFTLDYRMQDDVCNSDDVRAPKGIRINVEYIMGVRTGQAQMYMPRWLTFDGEPTCDDEITAATTGYMNTEYVGDDYHTTAAVYLSNGDLTNMADLPDWSFDNFPNHFPEACNGTAPDQYCFESPDEGNPISHYANNFCVDKVDDAHTWGESCTDSTVTEIAAGTYLDVTGWLLPSEMSNLFEELPEQM